MKMTKLSSLGTLRNGINYNKASAKKGCKIIGVADFGNRVFPDYSTLAEIDASIVSEADVLKDGDILFVRSNGNKNLVGRTMYIQDVAEPVCYSGFCIAFRPNEDLVYPKYLFYVLRSPFCKKQYSFSQQTNITNLSQEVLGSVDIPLPDLTIQKKLAEILWTLDRKIALNTDISSKLESMAKTLYDYWFVQFDFPDENGRPYRTSGGEMVWNAQLKQEIPKGWEIKNISDICEIISGYPFQSATYSKTGKYRLITIKNVQDSRIDLNVDNYIKILPKDLPSYCILSPGDILMSLTGNVGRVGLMYAYDCLLNQRVALIKPKHSYLNAFLYFLFKSNRLKILMENISTGTSQKNLSPVDTENLAIAFKDEIVKMFCDKLQLIITKIVIAEKEKVELTKLRDWLLPMLMNGQARVE